MLPDLQAALACEDVRLEANGFNTLVGVVSAIIIPRVPFRILKLCVYTRWTSGEGEFVQKTRILTPDERELAWTETKFRISSGDLHTTNIALFSGVEFQQYGDFPIEVLLDGDLRVRFTLRVAQAPPLPPGQSKKE